MSLLPAQKLLRVVKGTTFDYPFQYVLGSTTASTPLDTTGYQGNWIITYDGGQTIYGSSADVTNLTTLAQMGLIGSIPTNIQFGVIGSSSQAWSSGVAFAGNGVINLIISSEDTSNLPWMEATYQFVLTDPSGKVSEVLTGGIGVVDSIPASL